MSRYSTLLIAFFLPMLAHCGPPPERSDDDDGATSGDSTGGQTVTAASAGATTGGGAELSFFEQELVGIWTRQHVNGETQFIRFNGDRTGCKWEEAAGSETRVKVGNYPFWDLDEANPVGNDVYYIYVERAGIAWHFDYLDDVVYPDDYKANLSRTRSNSTKQCE